MEKQSIVKILNNKGIYFILGFVSFILVSCLPKIKEVNGNNISSKKFYLIEDTLNLVNIKNLKFWNLRLDSVNRLVSKQGNNVSVFCTKPCYNVNFTFTSKNGKRIKNLNIECGIIPSPILTIVGVDENDVISSIDLEFLLFLAKNDRHSPEIKSFNIYKMFCTYNNEQIWFDGARLSNHFIELINIHKPENFIIDSVEFKDKDNLSYMRKISRKININYSETKKCFKTEKNVYNYKNIEDHQIIEIDSTKCNFVFFSNLGSLSSVNIVNSNGDILYQETIKGISPVNSKNYFLLNGHSETLKINISGDVYESKIIVVKK